MNAEPQPRFLADRMVGKLVKWLRILGYDTVYMPEVSPISVKREAHRQGRILLTRRTCFLNQKDVPPFVFLRADRFREQLKQVCTDLQLKISSSLLRRCSACNRELETVDRAQVQARVPAYVWQTQSTFFYCRQCQRVYWGATHRDRIVEELRHMGIG